MSEMPHRKNNDVKKDKKVSKISGGQQENESDNEVTLKDHDHERVKKVSNKEDPGLPGLFTSLNTSQQPAGISNPHELDPYSPSRVIPEFETPLGPIYLDVNANLLAFQCVHSLSTRSWHVPLSFC